MNNKKDVTLDPLKDVEDVAKVVDSKVHREARKASRRYPITFALLSLFGFAAVLNGFEGLVAKNVYLSERPGFVLIAGLVILLLTGTLYKWITNKEIRM